MNIIGYLAVGFLGAILGIGICVCLYIMVMENFLNPGKW